MCDNEIDAWNPSDPALSRRTFGITAAAAATVGAACPAGAQARVVETDVRVGTADGVSDSALFHPAGNGPWPAVLLWTDIGGLRPVMRDMGRRLAAEGYVVLVPNPFYRSAPGSETARLVWGEPVGREKLWAYRGALVDGRNPFNDAKAYVAFLDAQPQTDRRRRIGVQGYCMGGALSFQTAGAAPDRVGAVASFHGGGLVTPEAESPHRLVAGTRASYLVAVARNDDAKAPGDKDVLKATFAETGRPAVVEVYDADHGWCVRGNPVYDGARAEKAWSELLALYGKALG